MPNPNVFLEWRCEFCGDMRPDLCVSVVSRDITPPHLPKGTMRRNRCYCADRAECCRLATEWLHMPENTGKENDDGRGA